MIEFVLLANKQGQTRLARYLHFTSVSERRALEGDVVRKCLRRKAADSNILEHLNYTIVYRRYASLLFIVGLSATLARVGSASGRDDVTLTAMDANPLLVFEFIQAVVEIFDRHFHNVCELDVMLNPEKAHFLLDEMISGGEMIETSCADALRPTALIESEDNEAP